MQSTYYTSQSQLGVEEIATTGASTGGFEFGILLNCENLRRGTPGHSMTDRFLRLPKGLWKARFSVSGLLYFTNYINFKWHNFRPTQATLGTAKTSVHRDKSGKVLLMPNGPLG